ncbi:chemotaxis protein CheX [Persicimonas caeni]|uniref:Chemotaxis protein CheX n=1 Tax=Persicimonas caeni TaxID=2292766 RepID=A0A4Y6PSK2_PERCE|nr:chemotaxis protein CheX [Persicimonas caeni]QDG51312.1 chemotaxis protein CheX [Persicimonas caeni]QED32533.1 chemotaxis protein CheX [Persicimonas caeni]
MQLTDADFEELIRSIWSIFAQPELEAASHDALAEHASEMMITAVVHVTGEEDGSVVVECPSRMASRLAGALFGLEADELADDEVHDALGEVANMLGGNVKGLFPSGSQLSLPTVVEGREFKLDLPGTQVALCQTYVSDGLAIRFSLMDRPSDA